MHRGDRIPAVSEQAPVRDALMEMTAKGLGMTAVVDGEGRVSGVFTDGDLRRCLDRGIDIHDASVDQVMTRGAQCIAPDRLAVEAINLMEEKQINALLVIDTEQRLCGALNMHDLLRAGVV